MKNQKKYGTSMLSRRQMLQTVAAGAAAATLPRSATADKHVPALRLPDQCKHAVTLIREHNGTGDGMTVSRFFYEPLRNNLDWMITNSTRYANLPSGDPRRIPTVANCTPLLNNLKTAFGQVSDPVEKDWSLRDFYFADFPSDYPQPLRGPFRALHAQAACPFLLLPNKAANNPHRPRAVALLDSSAFIYELRNVQLHLLFVRGRDDHLNAHTDPTKYLYARALFDLGILNTFARPLPPEDGADQQESETEWTSRSMGSPREETYPNDECWYDNVTSPGCDYADNKYCDTDNGQPTSSSDVCY